MGEPRTWRELLGIIVEDPQERLHIARTIGVNQITLARWIAGISSPRLRSLRILLDVLPEQRERFIQLLALDYPELLQEDFQEEEELFQIPASFYARALETYTSNPSILRGSTLVLLFCNKCWCNLIHTRWDWVFSLHNVCHPSLAKCEVCVQ